jgi:Ran GTPase-activating protein (RanGAP) involved in mRNA processing and transport
MQLGSPIQAKIEAIEPLSSDELRQYIEQQLKDRNTDLDISVRISDSTLNDDQMLGLLKQFKGLRLANSQLDQESIKPLYRVLRNNSTLTKLDLSGNNIGETKDLLRIIAANKKNQLQHLNLADINIDAFDQKTMESFFEKATQLEELILDNNTFCDDEALPILFTAMTNTNSLKTLSLQNVALTACHLEAISKFLENNQTLTNLNLTGSFSTLAKKDIESFFGKLAGIVNNCVKRTIEIDDETGNIFSAYSQGENLAYSNIKINYPNKKINQKQEIFIEKKPIISVISVSQLTNKEFNTFSIFANHQQSIMESNEGISIRPSSSFDDVTSTPTNRG